MIDKKGNVPYNLGVKNQLSLVTEKKMHLLIKA